MDELESKSSWNFFLQKYLEWVRHFFLKKAVSKPWLRSGSGKLAKKSENDWKTILFCSELFQNKIFLYNSFFSEKVSACRCQKWPNTWPNSIWAVRYHTKEVGWSIYSTGSQRVKPACTRSMVKLRSNMIKNFFHFLGFRPYLEILFRRRHPKKILLERL